MHVLNGEPKVSRESPIIRQVFHLGFNPWLNLINKNISASSLLPRDSQLPSRKFPVKLYGLYFDKAAISVFFFKYKTALIIILPTADPPYFYTTQGILFMLI